MHSSMSVKDIRSNNESAKIKYSTREREKEREKREREDFFIPPEKIDRQGADLAHRVNHPSLGHSHKLKLHSQSSRVRHCYTGFLNTL